MSGSIRRILVLTLAAGLMWHCGGERVTQSQPETTGPPLGKLTARGHASQAVVRVNLSQDGAPVSGAKVEFSRAIAGRAASYQWSGITDENGQARVEIAADNVTGYYRARAMQDGSEIDSWSSIPINAGYQVMLNLPIGGKARATGSSKMLMGEISIGVITSLTGPLASVSTMRNGIELARERNQSIHPTRRGEYPIYHRRRPKLRSGCNHSLRQVDQSRRRVHHHRPFYFEHDPSDFSPRASR